MEVSLKKSNRDGKKLMLIFYQDGKKKKTIHFGASGYKDYTIYSKEDSKIANIKKKNYISRHKVNENFNDYMTAGSASRWILWNKKTIKESYNNYLKKFKLKNL